MKMLTVRKDTKMTFKSVKDSGTKWKERSVAVTGGGIMIEKVVGYVQVSTEGQVREGYSLAY